MDASYKIQRGIHVHLIQFFMCPEFWVHIRVAKYHPVFPFCDGCDGRNGAGSTPQNTVATVASVALYPITSNAGASTTM